MKQRALMAIAGTCFGLGLIAGLALGPELLNAQPAAATPDASAAEKSEVPPEDGKLRIICFGAHPDDCEIKAGGTAQLWAAQGHHVKFVSVTNGDIGHWKIAGGPLAQRRKTEVLQADEMLGVHTEILDIHDGELLPTLENRKEIVRLIREWDADVVISPRPNDYHPDHRYTGVLVQDAAFMVAVPFFCPDVEPLEKNPVFLYFSDRFQKPNPFTADVIVGVDDVSERKIDALSVMESQFLEGGALGGAHLLTDVEGRRREVRARFAGLDQSIADKYRAELQRWYGEDRGKQIARAEAFEICEYGSQPSEDELRRLFPFFNSTE